MDDPSSPPAYTDTGAPRPADHKPPPQTVWIQDTDVSGPYRKRYILPADLTRPPQRFDSGPADDPSPPPTYTPAPDPLYTVKSHGRPSPLDFRAPSHPDITIYLGDGDAGPVVATGTLHTTPLKKSLGDVRFFPRPSAAASSAKDIPAITIKDKDAGTKYTFTHHGHAFTWLQTGRGEVPPTPPAPPATASPAPPATASPGLFSKLKRKAAKPATTSTPPPRDTKTWELSAGAGKIATYTELQPHPRPPQRYPDGHVARVDVHDPAFDVPGGGTELAVVSAMMFVEAQRRRIASAANRSWLDSGGGSAGGCGGGGGGCGGGGA